VFRTEISVLSIYLFYPSVLSLRYTEVTLLSVDCIYEHSKTFAHIEISLQKHNHTYTKLQFWLWGPTKLLFKVYPILVHRGWRGWVWKRRVGPENTLLRLYNLQVRTRTPLPLPLTDLWRPNTLEQISDPLG